MNFLAATFPAWALMLLNKQLQRVNYLDFEKVEAFLYFGPTNDEPFIFAGSNNDIARILDTKKQFDKANLQIQIYHSQYGPAFALSAFDNEGRTEVMKNIKYQIQIAKLLDASTMIIHGSSGPKGEYLNHREKRLNLIKDALEELEPEAKKHNIKIAVENMSPPAIFDDTVELVSIIELIDSDYINICLDTGHANMFGDVYESIRVCGQKLGHIHLHDNNTDRDEHAFPFTRTLNEDKFFTVLKEINYKNDITIEVTRLLDCDDQTAEKYKNKIKILQQLWVTLSSRNQNGKWDD